MKVIISNNSIVPYRTHFFNIFFNKYKKELDESMVLYLTENESIRDWKNDTKTNFKYKVLPRIYQRRDRKTTTADKIINYGFLKYLKNADIFYSLGYSYPTYLIMAFFCKMKGIKTACFCETNITDKSRYWFISKVKYILLNSLYDQFFVPGVNAKKYLLDLGISTCKIATIGNSAPFSFENSQMKMTDIQEKKYDFNLLYVGRLSEEKNIINALKNLEYVDPIINITIVGSGPLVGEINKLVSLSKHNYIIKNNIEREQLPFIYKQNDILLLPSLSEPWGLVVNEAISCGLGLLLSDRVGCAPDLVDGNGYIYDVHDNVDFINKFNLLYNDKEAYKKASLLLQEKISSDVNSTLLYNALRKLYETY